MLQLSIPSRTAKKKKEVDYVELNKRLKNLQRELVDPQSRAAKLHTLMIEQRRLANILSEADPEMDVVLGSRLREKAAG